MTLEKEKNEETSCIKVLDVFFRGLEAPGTSVAWKYSIEA
jgi:hypothetical protein